MNSKSANRLYMSTILCMIFFLVFYIIAYGINIGLTSSSLITEGALIVPTIIALIVTHYRQHIAFNNMLNFHKIKLSTVLLIVLFCILLNPLISCVNAITMLFTDNVVSDISPAIASTSPIIVILIIGILSPICEELTFRGVIFNAYKNDGNSILPVIMSALLFGLMHMNFNQTAYAFVIGIFLALLVNATQSLWSSIIFHIIFNSSEVILMYISALATTTSQDTVDSGIKISTVLIYAAVSVITTFFALKVLKLIAKNEGHTDELTASFHISKIKPQTIISASLIISVLICTFFMIFSQITI